jgi:hypothetical protein
MQFKQWLNESEELSDLAIMGNQYDTIIYDNDETNRTVWHKMDENTLSDTEKAMLGQVKVGKSGKPSKYEHPSEEEWDSLRPFLVQKSQKRNPNLNPELTAYTPGETLNLLDHPEIAKWHKKIINYKVPDQYDTVVLVPCAASKPWGMSCKSEFYQAYHQIKNDPQYKNLFFATVSEPLGIVPQDMWEDFPQYDNPGLFDDTAMQSGLMTKDWSKSPIKTKRVMPFDTNAYDQSIDKLSNTIAKFLDNNNDKKFLAFVDHPDGSLSTHGDMLNKASKSSGVAIKRFSKKEKSGREKNQLLPFLKSKLNSK